MDARTLNRRGRGRWLAVAAVMAAVLTLGLLGRLATPQTAADDNWGGYGGPAEEFSALCSQMGGTLSSYDASGDSSSGIHVILFFTCAFQDHIARCDFWNDGTFTCYDVPTTPVPGGQTGTYFPAPTVVSGSAGLAGVLGGKAPVNAPVDNGSPPTPTPTRSRAGGVTIAPINGVAANGVNPTPTPTKGHTGVAGGITIAPINGGVKAPVSSAPSPTPLPGPRSGIALNLWDCPLQAPTVPLRGPGTPAPPPLNCHTQDNVTNKAIFIVGGPTGQVTIHGSGILMNGLPAGKYFIRLTTIPSGYGKPVGYCGFARSEEQGPNGWTQVAVADGYTVEIPQDETVYCDWYITYNPANAPVKAAVASPVPPAAATPAP